MRNLIIVASTIGVLIAALLAGCGWLIGTTAGARWLAERVPGLEADITDGTLLQGFRVANLGWRNGLQAIEIQDLTATWDAGCLLQRHWCVSNLLIGSVKVVLAPADKQAAGDSKEPVVLPSVALPFDVSLTTVAIGPVSIVMDTTRIELARLETSLRMDGSDVQLDNLHVVHESGEASARGRIELQGDYPLDVTIDAQFHEPVNAQRIALAASLFGSVGNLQLITALRSDIGDVTLNGRVRPLEAQPEYTIAVVSNRIKWPVDATYHFTVREARLGLEGRGDSFQLGVTSRIDADPLQDAQLRLQARGDRVALQIDDLSVRSALVDAATTGQLALSPAPAWRGETTVAKLSITRWVEQLRQPIRGRTRVAARSVDGVWRIDLDALQLESTIEAQPVSIQGQLSGFSDGRWLAPELIVASDANRLSISGDGDYDAENGVAGYRFDVSWEELSWPPAPDAQLQARDGRLRIVGKNDEFAVTGEALLAAAHAPTARTRFDVQGNRAKVDVQAIHIETLAGSIEAQGTLHFDELLTWQARAELADLDPGRHWPELTGNLHGTVVADGVLAAERLAVMIHELDIQGELRGAAVAAEARAYADQTGLVRLDNIRLRSDENYLSLSGTRLDQWALRGEADIPDIARLMPGVSGAATGTFRIDGALERPDVTLAVSGRDLVIDGTRIAEAEVTGTIREFGHQQSELAARIGAVQTESVTMNAMTLRILGTREDHSVALQMDGQPVAVAFALRGTLADTAAWRGTVGTADVQTPTGRWVLTNPMALEWSPTTQTVQLPAHCWRQSLARLCLVEPAAVGQAGSVIVRLTDFDVATLGALLPENTSISGLLGADGRVRWAAGEPPALALSGVLREGQVARVLAPAEESVRYEFQALAVQAELDAEQLDADIGLETRDNGSVSAQLTVRPIHAPWPLAGQIDLRGLNIATLAAFFPQLTTLKGIVDANGSLGGDLNQPVFTGQVTARDIALAAQDLPLSLQNGRIDVQVRGTEASFTAQAQAGEGGDLQVRGDAEWSTASWAVTLGVQGQDVMVRQTPLFEARTSPNLTLAMAPRRIEVTGELAVPWARVTLRELPPDVTRVSRDVVIVDADSPVGGDDWQIETHILITLGPDVRFDGLGLRAGLSGDLKIDQVESKPVSATGEIVINDGEYSAYGQKLKVTEGRLLFVGSLQPDVTLTAVREVGDVTAGLQLQGTLERPQTTLFANPPQTDTNTLSYIVLGRPIDVDNREDGTVLTQAALALGLAGGGRGLATEVAEQFGIEDFQIDTQDDPTSGTQIVLRGRLSPNLTVRYGVGVLTPDTVLTLRYKLTERLYVEVAEGVQNALDFFYSISF